MAQENSGKARRTKKIKAYYPRKPHKYIRVIQVLFTKKNKFEILDSQIKEELKAPDESVILRLNLRYPEIHCQKKDPLYANAKDLYPRLAKSLEEYGKTELYQKALRAYNSDKEDFLPYALVMRWENTFIDKDYLSILLDISVSYGNDSPSIERKTQVWDRKNKTYRDIEYKDIVILLRSTANIAPSFRS